MKTKIEKKLSVDWYKKSSRTFLGLSKNYTRSRESLKKAFFEKQQQGYSGRTERNKSMNLKVGDFHVNQRLYKSLGFTYCFFFEKWKLWWTLSLHLQNWFETWPIIASNISQTDINGNLKEAFLSVNSKVNWGKFVHELNIKEGFLHYSLLYFLSTAQCWLKRCLFVISFVLIVLLTLRVYWLKELFCLSTFGGKTGVAKYGVFACAPTGC